MLENDGKPGGGSSLYPNTEPFARLRVDVTDGHQLYLEQSGNPDGVPVVVLHGGPGGGCSPGMRRFFDPTHYHAVLFDQRGCGKSQPHSSLEANTTWHLVADIERLRERLGIDKWIVFGGSWGATLALIYAISHPDRVSGLVLRGIFLMMQRELDWFYGGGAGQFRPEVWERVATAIPREERDDLIAAYHRRLTAPDQETQSTFARLWTGWEAACATHRGADGAGPGGAYARAFARIETHYFVNRGWLGEDGWILKNMDKIAHIPGHIVQGRYDLVCPPVSSYAVHRAWPGSELHMIGDAGHALSERGVSAKLVEIMDRLR